MRRATLRGSERSSTTAAATTGPASGPRPTSSTPITIPGHCRSREKSGTPAPHPVLRHYAPMHGDESNKAASGRNGAPAGAAAIRGILFDKDGTLVDYFATWTPAYRTAAQP